MTKTDKNFKMKRSTKTFISLMGGSDATRIAYKHAMIDAQVCEETARRQSLKSNSNNNNSQKFATTVAE